jgi:hypothetical protein
MGLFRRGDRRNPEATQDFSDRRPHSHVALAPEDVEDSKRCRPEADLEPFAQARGLTFGGSVILGTFVGVLPTWAEYVFNSCRGELAPGRFGAIQHELLEIDVNPNDPSGSGISGLGGQFWAVKRGVPPNWKKRLVPGVIELGMDEPPNEPFASYATWAPVTSVYVHVPEAACAPRISVGSADRHNAIGNRSLDDVGLPHLRLLTDIPEDLLTNTLGGDAGRALGAVDAPYVSMLLSFSQLRLTRNGFVEDDAELDALIAHAVAIADGLAAACSPDAGTASFATPLPRPEPQTGRLAGIDRWDETFAAAEKQFGMTLEDPRAYHAAFPHLQAPGTARGVLNGTMPGGATGRLAFHEHGGRRSGFLRGVALFEAPAGAQPTPPGGVLHEPTQMYVAVGDGIVACWNRQMDPGTLAVTPTAERAQQTLRDLNLT